MKVQVKRAFKIYFFVTKNFLHFQNFVLIFFFHTSVQRCLYLLFQNQCLHFLLPLFFEEYLNPQVRINIMVNKHTADCHPSPSQLTLKIHPLIFLWTPKVFISPESFLNFFLKLFIPPWCQIYGVQTTGKYICESKN